MGSDSSDNRACCSLIRTDTQLVAIEQGKPDWVCFYKWPCRTSVVVLGCASDGQLPLSLVPHAKRCVCKHEGV